MTSTTTPKQTNSSGTKIPVSVLVVIFDPQGRFLLIERADKANYWQSVTGSLDAWDENPINAAVRELQEETGITAQPDLTCPPMADLPLSRLTQPFLVRAWPHSLEYEIFVHWRHRYPEGVTHNTEHWFHVCVPEGTVPRLAPREHVGFEWVDSDVAQQRCFSPNNAQAIDALDKQLKRLL